jgi:hypothetical protein
MPCEDAPCCGCCGLNAWYQEDLAAYEARFESLDDDFYDEFESNYGQPPCSGCGAPESACICEPEPGPYSWSPGTGRPQSESDVEADKMEARDTKARGWS